jgi:hypothetical protein
LPVIYTNTTPTICSLNGAQVTSLSKGICSISLSQAGSSDYLPATSVATIASDPQVYASGYSADGLTTLEGGQIDMWAGGAGDHWEWCGATTSSDCPRTITTNPNGITQSFMGWSSSPLGWGQLRLFVYAPGAAKSDAPTIGLLPAASATSLKFNLGTNPEWYSTTGDTKNRVHVLLTLGRIGSETCNITLSTDFVPASASITPYVISLKNSSATLPVFSTWDDWKCHSSSVEAALATHPIAEITFHAAGAHPWDDGANVNVPTVPTPAKGSSYETTFKLEAITVQ